MLYVHRRASLHQCPAIPHATSSRPSVLAFHSHTPPQCVLLQQCAEGLQGPLGVPSLEAWVQEVLCILYVLARRSRAVAAVLTTMLTLLTQLLSLCWQPICLSLGKHCGWLGGWLAWFRVCPLINPTRGLCLSWQLCWCVLVCVGVSTTAYPHKDCSQCDIPPPHNTPASQHPNHRPGHSGRAAALHRQRFICAGLCACPRCAGDCAVSAHARPGEQGGAAVVEDERR